MSRDVRCFGYRVIYVSSEYQTGGKARRIPRAIPIVVMVRGDEYHLAIAVLEILDGV